MINKLELKKEDAKFGQQNPNNIFDNIDSDIAEIVKKINEIIDKLNDEKI